MIPYDYLELLKAIRTCVEKRYYKVGVFTANLPDAQDIYSDAIDAISQDDEENPMVHRYAKGICGSNIIFNNGSIITFLNASDNARGYKFHRVLYCRNIDHDILATCVHPTEIRYREGNL